MLRIALSIAALALLCFAPLQAQQTNVGNITGSVQDPSGAIVREAAVVALNLETGVRQSAVTTTSGVYIVSLLPVGRYTVTVEKPGFVTASRQEVAVIAGQTFTVDFTLRVGSTAETINVSAHASTVDTTSATQGTTRTQEELELLPFAMNGNSARAAVSAIDTLAGVNSNIMQANGAARLVISRALINGVVGGFGYQIDGVDAASPHGETAEDVLVPIPDQVAEVRLVPNTDATQGFNGGVAVAMVTKSGTNAFHGNVFYYNRNDAFEARNWFLPNVAKDKQNEGGFTFGGPVRIPKVYNGKNKTFFFGGIDIYRFVTTQAAQQRLATASVATVAQRTGDFRDLLGPQIGTDSIGRPVYKGEIYDPQTTRLDGNGNFIRDPFTYGGQLNVVPPSRLSKISQFFMNDIAKPTSPGVASNWVGAANPSATQTDTWNLKVDHSIGERHRFSFSVERMFFLGVPELSGVSGSQGFMGPITQQATTGSKGENRYRLTYIGVFRPDLIFNFRAGIIRDANNGFATPYPITGAATTAGCDAGLKGTLDCRTPTIGIENLDGFGPQNLAWGNLVTARAPFSASLQWVKGKHQFTFGADYIYWNLAYNTQTDPWGAFNFNHLETSLPVAGAFQNNTGAGIASYMLGEVHGGSITSGVQGMLKLPQHALFAQDNWRVSPKLTVNLGLRWEIVPPARETQGRIASFDPNLANPGAGGKPGALSVFGNGPGRNGKFQVGETYYRAFAPKIGLAYAFNPKTVFRANFGLSYFPFAMKWAYGRGSLFPTDGFSTTLTSQTLDNGVTSAFNWDNGFPTKFPQLPSVDPSFNNGRAITYLNPGDNRPPLVENIGAELERELPGRISLRAAYVGTMSHRMYATYNMNTMPLADLSLGSVLNQNITSAAAKAANIPLPYAGFNSSVAQALRPYPQYTAINALYAQIGNANYNSLQINLQRHFGSLTMLGAFTAAKFLSSSDSPGQNNGTMLLKAQTIEQFNTAKSLYGFNGGAIGQSGDVSKQLKLSWYWTVPMGRGQRFLGDMPMAVDYLLGNWRVSAIQTYQGGQPISVTTNVSVAGVGTAWAVRNNDVPMVISGGCSALQPGINGKSAYLNKGAFSDPAAFRLGDTFVLSNARQCGYYNENLGLDKGIPFGEKRRVSIGAMITNLFNRHAFVGLNRNIDSPTFGTYGSATLPRTVQFYSKVTF